MRIGFLFNHDQIHQIPHSLPIALELANMGGHEVVAITSSPLLSAEVTRLGKGKIGSSIELIELGLKPLSRALAAIASPIAPASKLFFYRDNLDYLKSFDALVVSEKTSLILKTRFGLTRPRLIHTRHGAGDRAIGFNASSKLFDHVLCSGPKIRDRLVQDLGMLESQVSIIGYPKFDLFDEPSVAPSIHGKPVAVYNPHPAPHLSSWYPDGNTILGGLTDHGMHTLFAPHIMLFERRYAVSLESRSIRRPPPIDPRFLSSLSVTVDTSSSALSDMSYLMLANCYVGDASSQVYEFLKTPRPCIFVNSNRIAWQGNPDFGHWNAGPVIEDASRIGEAVDEAFASHEHLYKPIQQEMFANTFDLTDTPSSVRGAQAVIDYLDRDRVR